MGICAARELVIRQGSNRRYIHSAAAIAVAVRFRLVVALCLDICGLDPVGGALGTYTCRIIALGHSRTIAGSRP